MKYLLVRHPESMQNIEKELNVLDPKVGFSDYGKKQVVRLLDAIHNEVASIENVGVYYSPYVRTKNVVEALKEIMPHWQYIEEPLISEIQVGDLEGYTIEEFRKNNPQEYERFLKYKQSRCRFWYKYPAGESPFDLNVRVNIFLNKLGVEKYDAIIIVSHLHLLKVLEMNLLGEDLEWYENAKSMNNAEVHVIEDMKVVAKHNIVVGEDK